MSSEAVSSRMTYAEYCAFECEAEVKHEYISGEVFALAGGTLEHGRLCVELGHRLRTLDSTLPPEVLTERTQLIVAHLGECNVFCRDL